MAVTETNRLGVISWSSDSDPFTRSQMDISHQAIETLAAKFIASSSQPLSSSSNSRTFWLNTNNNSLSYYNSEGAGGQWLSVNTPGTVGQMTTLSFSTTANSAGNQSAYARIDHTHGLPEAEILAFLSNYIAKDIVITKGDIIAATGSASPVRQPVGSNNQVLIADSSTATGIRWGAIPGSSIQDGAIANSKLSAGAVTNDKVTDVAVVKVSDAYGKGTAAPAGRRITIAATQPAGAANGDIWIRP